MTERFNGGAANTSVELRSFEFVYPTPQHFVDFFRTYYGPVEKAFANLDVDGQDALEADILALIEEYNVATDGTMRVPSEYAQVVITKS